MKFFFKTHMDLRQFSYAVLTLLLAAIMALTSCQNGAGQNSNEMDSKQTEETEALLAGEVTGEITISCYDTELYKAFLEDAKVLFEAKYPGTTVNIETFSSPPTVTTMENEDGTTSEVWTSSNDGAPDYISRVTTDIMGGKGADIYAMDVLPYHKYAGSGSLSDLRYFMQADPEFDISNYRANIFEGVKYRGGQYVLPMDFHFELMIFDREKAGEEAAAKLRAKNEFTYWEMTDIVKERFAADESGAKIMDFLFIDDITRMMFNSLWMNNLNSYINREDNTVNFTDGKFAEFLTKYKEQADQNYFKSPLTEGEGNYIAGFADPNSQIGYYFKSMLSYQIKDSFVYDAMAAIGKDTSMYSYTIKPNDERLGVLVNDNGQGAYEYYTGFAMNSNSGNKKTAWEFIKLLLGEQMQTSIRLLGIPVNKTAYERYVKQNITESPNYIQGETEGEYTADGFIEIDEDREAREAALAEYTLYMEEILPKLTYAVIRDNTINDMVRGEFEAFFNGEKTAEEAAQELQNKVGMYLSE